MYVRRSERHQGKDPPRLTTFPWPPSPGVDGAMLRACSVEDIVADTGLSNLAARGLMRILHPPASVFAEQ